MSTSSFIKELHYVRIPVIELEASVDWYKDCLGFELLHMDLQNKLAVLKMASGFLVTLVQADKDSYSHFTINDKSEFILGFTSPEPQQFHQHLINFGAKVEEILEDNGHYYFHFYDPSGNKLQVHW